MSRPVARYNLQVKSLNTRSTFPLRGDFEDTFVDRDAADAQASTLSVMDKLQINAWGGPVWIKKSEEDFEVVVISLSAWCVVGGFHNGARSYR